MIYLPNEIINIILSYRNRHPINIIINYLINDCYMKDFDPYYSYYNEYYFHTYSFFEWYFLIIRNKSRKLTKIILKIGFDKFDRSL